MPEIIDFFQFGNNDFRAIINSQKGKTVYGTHHIDGESFCACLGYKFRKTCSHLDELFQAISERGKLMVEYNTVYETSLNSLNKVLNGGIPVGSLLGFFGSPQCGKSTTSAWVLLDIMRKKKQNGLYVDTEMGMAREFLPDLINRYNKKFNTDFGLKHLKLNYKEYLRTNSPVLKYITLFDDEKELQIVVVDLPDFQQLSLFLGKPYKLDLDSAKPSIQQNNASVFENIWDTPMGRLLDDPNGEDEFCGFVLDSLTTPMKIFGVQSQSFPVRDTAQSVVLNQLAHILFENSEMVGIGLFHASRPPQNSNVEPTMVGGKSVHHSCKNIVLFSNPKQKGLNTEVVITPYRLPTKIGNQAGQILSINDTGVF